MTVHLIAQTEVAGLVQRGEGIEVEVVPREKQETIRKVLEWYRSNHPVWFDWLEIA